MRFIKPLNQRGFGHIELVLAVLFIGLFAFVGVRIVNKSSAAVPPPTGGGTTAPTPRTTPPPSWKTVKSQTGSYKVYLNKYYTATALGTDLEYNIPYRICYTGKSTGASSVISQNTVAFGSTTTLGTTSKTTCTKSYTETSKYIGSIFTPTFMVSKGSTAVLTSISMQAYK